MPLVAQIAEVMEERAAAGLFSGAALLSVRGEVLLDRLYGRIAAHAPTGVPGETAFRIGCLSKQFTAAAILRLCEQGKLAPGHAVHQYLPELPVASRSKNGVEVTIEHAMASSSGFASFRSSPLYQENLYRREITAADLFDFLAEQPLEFVPGTSFRYSTTAYHILALVIERVTGKPFDEALEELVLGPAGLSRTGENPARAMASLVTGHRPDAAGVLEATTELYEIDPRLTCLTGSGSLYTTTHDVARWIKALAAGAVVRPAHLEEMLRPRRNFYGFGMITWTNPRTKTTLHWHNGGVRGYSALQLWDRVNDIVIVALQDLDPEVADVGLVSRILSAIERSADGRRAAS